MTNNPKMLAFGPVPSRRLGHSMGINNIPPKICTYSCVYCQVGRTMNMQVKRRAFYKPEEIAQAVEEKLKEAKKREERVDYLTFVPDGEPTLDANLGRAIELLKPLGVKIAVITNASLIWLEDVRRDLLKANWVSLKVDSINEEVWRRINRPHRSLHLDSILEGMLEFAESFHGELVTETMLVKDVNDSNDTIKEIADFLPKLKPAIIYLSVPTRPPAEKGVQLPDEKTINESYQILSEKNEHVEYLIGYEGNAFAFTGNVEEDLLSITSVHPMREDAVKGFISKANADLSLIDKLIGEDRLIETKYRGKKFYIRRLPRSRF